jgi:hypothetical protein
LKYRVLPLLPSYIGERRTTSAKAYGINESCYGEHVGEHIGNFKNLMGIHWELKGNTLGTREKWKKNPLFFLRAKKQGTLSACLGLPIGCMKFLFPKEFLSPFLA